MKKIFLLSFAGFFFSTGLQAQQIVLHPVPQELIYSRHNDDFTVQIRQEGGEWLDLYEYRVMVDLDTHSKASMVQFDFEGKIDVKVKVNNGIIHDVKIRPLNNGIKHSVEENIIYFSLEQPAKLSLEINRDRLHNLHIFANPVEKEIPAPNAPNVMYFAPGLHKSGNDKRKSFDIPSNTTVYLAPGAVVEGKFVCNNVENVRFTGRGIILEPQRGFEITHSKNIEIDGLTVINPVHYTVYGGESTGLKINNLKSFSDNGWSDGIDLMSCSDVNINDVFMRNSDDCIAIYTHRWNFYGDARNYTITNAILWADIAHPINIGLHGDTSIEGNVIENIRFSGIDILEQDEDDPNYQGCMTFSESDHNLIQDVSFENVRIENIQEGQLFNLRVLFNEKYSTGPGRKIRDITFKNIFYNGTGENASIIEGFSPANNIENIVFENIVIRGKKIQSFEEGNIKIGKYTHNIILK
jgi:polygalacturonase